MVNQKFIFHHQLAPNFLILVMLVFGGWFLYYSFAPPKYAAQVNKNEDGIYNGGNFRMKPPSGWLVGDGAAVKVAALFISPTEDGANGKTVRSNINIVMEPTAQTLDEYVKQSREALKKSIQRYSSTEYKKTKIDGRDAYMIGGTFIQDNEQLRNQQLIMVSGGSVYIVTGTALNSAWSKRAQQISDAIASFDL